MGIDRDLDHEPPPVRHEDLSPIGIDIMMPDRRGVDAAPITPIVNTMRGNGHGGEMRDIPF